MSAWILILFSGSVKRDESNLQVLVGRGLSGNDRVIVTGWWSERNMGSIEAFVRCVRSFCER